MTVRLKVLRAGRFLRDLPARSGLQSGAVSNRHGSLLPDEFLAHAVAAVPVERGGWAELFLERTETLRGEWDSRAGARILPGIREGFAVRRANVSEQRHVSAEGLQPDRILATCRTLDAAPSPLFPPEPGEGAAEGAGEEESRLASILGALAREISEGLAGRAPFLLSLERRDRRIGVISSGHRPRRDRTTRAVLTCRFVSPTGEIALGAGAEDLDRLLERHPAKALAEEALQRLEEGRDARDVPEGESVIVLAPGTGGVFFHEACGHALEGDLVLREASVFRELVGEKVAPEFVGAMDDPRRPQLEGSYSCDDEGSSGRGTVLIAKGILKAFLTDRISAGRLGRRTTGNGRRESFRDLPAPRMSNTFLMPGGDDPEEILRETPRGIFVRRLTGGRVDTATGEFLFRADSGSLIEEGCLTAPLRPFSIAGNGLAALRGIERVGGDLYFGIGAGSCGKEGQRLPVAVGQPTLRIRSLFVRPG
jgi:TldD protein